MKKVVFLTNIPSHYRVGLIKRAYKSLQDKDVKFITLFSKETYSRRDYWDTKTCNYDFDYDFIEGKNSFVFGNKLIELGISAIDRLKLIKPDLIILTGFSIQSMLVARYCIKRNTPYIIYTGETEITFKQFKFGLIREYLRKKLMKYAFGFFAYGTASKNYLMTFGIPEERIYIVINTIDTDDFRIALENNTEGSPYKGGGLNVLYVGELRWYKGVKYLLYACNILRNMSDIKFNINIVGSGESEVKLQNLAKKLNLTNVWFHGKIDYSSIVKFYKHCDIFVLPSLIERFGLVLVEAAIAEKPLISSEYTGASLDLIIEGENGFIINPHETENFSNAILKLLYSEQMRNKFGNKSKEIINCKVNINLATDIFVKGILKGLN